MKWIAIVLGLLVVLFVGGRLYYGLVTNPRVAQELRDEPQGERAKKVMLITLPSGRELPVNYWREGDKVFAGADGRWWKELDGGGHAVTVFVQGQTHSGTARAVTDDPEYTKRVFAELRPNALPGFGTLVEVVLEPREAEAP